ncbi:MAG: hypothetical protein KAJ51_09935 [Thermoplasmata archaeon]|nr:hypothetical protein [Thermoplasmata archaeon]
MTNKKFLNDINGDTCLLSYLLIAFGIFIFGLFISLILFATKKKKIGLFAIILTIILTISIPSIIYYHNSNLPNEFKYRLIIDTNSTGEYVLIVPYLNNRDLKTDLEIESGNGSFEFIYSNSDTYYNVNTIDALKIRGNSGMVISGSCKDNSWSELSIIDIGETRRSCIWVWCNKTDPEQNITISFNAGIFGDGNVHWISDPEYQMVENGWNKILIDESSSED